MSDAFICRRGGAGTGGELTVNAPVGVTVIAVNSATEKTYTKTANADGVAVFKGLPGGTYNITISDGTTTTEPVSVVVSYKAETTVAFFQATINITYPAGSTCTCTCGDVSFTAPNTSGTWACIVPNAGTWTVSCTDGENTKSEDVVISTTGENKAVTLTYYLYLYNHGDQCTDVTGGWKKYTESQSEVVFNTDNITINSWNYSERSATAYTANKISTAGYTKLGILYTSERDTSLGYRKYGLISSVSTNTSYSAYKDLARGTEVTAMLDLSAAAESYIGANIHDCTIVMYAMWLE